MDCSERNKCIAFNFFCHAYCTRSQHETPNQNGYMIIRFWIRTVSHVDAHNSCISLVLIVLPISFEFLLSPLAYQHRQARSSIAVHVRWAYISLARLLNAPIVGSRKKNKGKCYTIISLDSAHITIPQHKYTSSIETARKMKKRRAKQKSDDESSRANTSIRLIRAHNDNESATAKAKHSAANCINLNSALHTDKP